MDNRQILSEIIVQILGFLIVFGVLKHFAWGKLLGILDTRRRSIEESFSSIQKEKDGLAELEKEYRSRLEHIEQEARAKIQEASSLGLALARDIQERARLDSEKILSRAKAEIDHDKAKARLEMRDQIVNLSSLMAEKIISQKVDSKENEKLVDQFMKEMANL